MQSIQPDSPQRIFNPQRPKLRPPLERLGIRPARDQGLAQWVRQGAPYGVFDALREALDISQGRLAELAAIPISTLKRREADGRFNLQESDRLLRLATVYTRALELFEEDQPQGRQWLKNPARALSGVSPLEHAQTEIGAREVLDLIGRLEYGVLS